LIAAILLLSLWKTGKLTKIFDLAFR